MKKYRYSKAASQEEIPILKRLERCHTLLNAAVDPGNPEWHEMSFKARKYLNSFNSESYSLSTTSSSVPDKCFSSSSTNPDTNSEASTMVISDNDLASSWLYKSKKGMYDIEGSSNEVFDSSLNSVGSPLLTKVVPPPPPPPPPPSPIPTYLQKQLPVLPPALAINRDESGDDLEDLPKLKLKPVPVARKQRSKYASCCYFTVTLLICICLLGLLSSIGGILYLEYFTPQLAKQLIEASDDRAKESLTDVTLASTSRYEPESEVNLMEDTDSSNDVANAAEGINGRGLASSQDGEPIGITIGETDPLEDVVSKTLSNSFTSHEFGKRMGEFFATSDGKTDFETGMKSTAIKILPSNIYEDSTKNDVEKVDGTSLEDGQLSLKTRGDRIQGCNKNIVNSDSSNSCKDSSSQEMGRRTSPLQTTKSSPKIPVFLSRQDEVNVEDSVKQNIPGFDFTNVLKHKTSSKPVTHGQREVIPKLQTNPMTGKESGIPKPLIPTLHGTLVRTPAGLRQRNGPTKQLDPHGMFNKDSYEQLIPSLDISASPVMNNRGNSRIRYNHPIKMRTIPPRTFQHKNGVHQTILPQNRFARPPLLVSPTVKFDREMPSAVDISKLPDYTDENVDSNADSVIIRPSEVSFDSFDRKVTPVLNGYKGNTRPKPELNIQDSSLSRQLNEDVSIPPIRSGFDDMVNMLRQSSQNAFPVGSKPLIAPIMDQNHRMPPLIQQHAIDPLIPMLGVQEPRPHKLQESIARALRRLQSLESSNLPGSRSADTTRMSRPQKTGVDSDEVEKKLYLDKLRIMLYDSTEQ